MSGKPAIHRTVGALTQLRAAGLDVSLESDGNDEFFVLFPRSLLTERLRELVKTRHQEIWNELKRESENPPKGESP